MYLYIFSTSHHPSRWFQWLASNASLMFTGRIYSCVHHVYLICTRRLKLLNVLFVFLQPFKLQFQRSGCTAGPNISPYLVTHLVFIWTAPRKPASAISSAFYSQPNNNEHCQDVCVSLIILLCSFILFLESKHISMHPCFDNVPSQMNQTIESKPPPL